MGLTSRYYLNLHFGFLSHRHPPASTLNVLYCLYVRNITCLKQLNDLHVLERTATG